MVPFTAETDNTKNFTLIVSGISQSLNGTLFTCEVIIRLSQGNMVQRTIDFKLITEVK